MVCGRQARTRQHPFFGHRICVGSVFGKAVGGDQTSVLRLQPAAPMRRARVADIRHRRAACPGRRRHAPTHQHHFFSVAVIANHRRRIIWKDTSHRRKVAGVSIHASEQGSDCSLVSRDRIEIAHITVCPRESSGMILMLHRFSNFQTLSENDPTCTRATRPFSIARSPTPTSVRKDQRTNTRTCHRKWSDRLVDVLY